MIEYPELNDVQRDCVHDWRPWETSSMDSGYLNVRVMCPKCAVTATMQCKRLRYSAEPSSGFGNEDDEP